MSITNELRKWVKTLYIPCSDELKREAERIADRIDAAHERLMGEQYKSLTIDMKPMTDEHMAEGGWVRLPMDGDGKPIRVGDVITHVPDGIKELAPETVKRIVLSKDEVTEECSYSMPKFLRHYHESTVEDLLADVADRAANLTGSYHEGGMNGDEYMDSMRALVAEYATKLRLADDGEEQ